MIVLEFGRGIMKIFLAIKYYEDMRNKNLIEKICSSFESKNITVFQEKKLWTLLLKK